MLNSAKSIALCACSRSCARSSSAALDILCYSSGRSQDPHVGESVGAPQKALWWRVSVLHFRCFIQNSASQTFVMVDRRDVANIPQRNNNNNNNNNNQKRRRLNAEMTCLYFSYILPRPGQTNNENFIIYTSRCVHHSYKHPSSVSCSRRLGFQIFELSTDLRWSPVFRCVLVERI
jgi:hypothetical protein